MVYAQGEIVEASDYNALISAINNIFGIGNGNAGYGGNSTNVSLSALINVNSAESVDAIDWQNLRNSFADVATHQNTVLPDTLPSLSLLDVGDILTFFASLNSSSNITAVTNNRLIVGAGNTTITTKLTDQRTDPWSDFIRHEFDVTFTSPDNARYYFNTGGQIRLNASLMPSTSSPQNDSWEAGLSANSPYTFSAANYYSLTGSFTVLRQVIANGGGSAYAYTNNLWTISARRVDSPGSNGSNGAVIRFRSDFLDGHSNTFFDFVDGVFTSTIEEVRSTGVFVRPSPVFSTTQSISAGASDSIPNSFTFIDQTNIPPSTVVTSNTFTVTGINIPIFANATGVGNIIKNGTPSGSGPVSVANGDMLALRLTSSATPLGVVNSTLDLSGVNDTFSVTTEQVSGTQSFTSTSTFNVPTGITQIQVKLWGGSGGAGGPRSGRHGGNGGGGQFVNTLLSVTPGETLSVTVGTGGTSGQPSTVARGLGGIGVGNGGNGGNGSGGAGGAGGGGGGTAIERGVTNLAVAAGGGGGGGSGTTVGGDADGGGVGLFLGSGENGEQGVTPSAGPQGGKGGGGGGNIGGRAGQGGVGSGSNLGGKGGSGGQGYAVSGTVENGNLRTPGGTGDVDYPGAPIAEGALASSSGTQPIGNRGHVVIRYGGDIIP